MSDQITHTTRGTVDPVAFRKFFKEHFKPGGEGGRTSEPEARVSCEGVGCPSSFGGGGLTGCTIEISNGKVTDVHCHYAAAKKQ
jgi:hypothetical protein